MKTFIRVLMIIAAAILIKCSNVQNNTEQSKLAGIWQNCSTPASAIEFTADGEYYLRLDGARITFAEPGSANPDAIKNLPDSLQQGKKMTFADEDVMKYTYDSLADKDNLRIYADDCTPATLATLTFIEQDKIRIARSYNGHTVSVSEYLRVRE